MANASTITKVVPNLNLGGDYRPGPGTGGKIPGPGTAATPAPTKAINSGMTVSPVSAGTLLFPLRKGV